MSEYYQKLRESGEDLCFAVTYQLTENFAKYSERECKHFENSPKVFLNSADRYINKRVKLLFMEVFKTYQITKEFL